ncbi:TPA: Arc family DNA-binding protein [Klebsiella quasipneumoniae subsp. quasipneumoniae]|nr:Arc family DNA-binding protein [Klebsiella quasipneumoniae subsp. quasipneumoniae]
MKSVPAVPPTGIRFPDDIKRLLKEVAKRDGRSMNSEVVKRIERSLREDGFIKS